VKIVCIPWLKVQKKWERFKLDNFAIHVRSQVIIGNKIFALIILM